MKERRYGGNAIVRTPPPRGSYRSKERAYSPFREAEEHRLPRSYVAERPRTPCRRSFERRDYVRHYGDGDRDAGLRTLAPERRDYGRHFDNGGRRRLSPEKRDYDTRCDDRGPMRQFPERRDYGKHFDDRGPMRLLPEKRDNSRCYVDEDSDRAIERLSQFNKSLMPSNSAIAMKFQWKHLLDEHQKVDIHVDHNLKHSVGSEVGGTRVTSERECRSQFVGEVQAELSCERPISFKAEGGNIYSAYPSKNDISLSSARVDSNFLLPLQIARTVFHENENLQIRAHAYADKVDADSPISRELYKVEEKPTMHLRDVSDYKLQSSRSATFISRPTNILKEGLRPFFKEEPRVPSVGVESNGGMITTPIGLEEYGQKHLTRSPVDHDVRSSGTRSYPDPYLSSGNAKRGDYVCDNVHRNGRDDMNIISDEISGKRANGRRNYEPTNLFKNSTDLDADRTAECSDMEHLRGSRIWDHHPSSQELHTDGYTDANGLLNTRKRDDEILNCVDSKFDYGSEINKGDRNLQRRKVYGLESSGVSCSHEKRLEMYSTRSTDLDRFEQMPSEELDLHQSSNKARSKISHHGTRKVCDWNNDADRDSLYLSKRSRTIHSPWRKTGNNSSCMGMYGALNDIDLISSDDALEAMPRQLLVKSHTSAGRNIKERLGPGPINVFVSHASVGKNKPSVMKRLGPGFQKVRGALPWVKTCNSRKFLRIEDNIDEIVYNEGENHVESNSIPSKTEPPENSEEFIRLVQSAFLKFVKHLNENTALKRRIMEQGKAVSLKCSICCSDSEVFVDAQSLAKHAFFSSKSGCRSQHLGFHRALCVLMGWRSASAASPWVCMALSDGDSSALKEDLIIWPPVVIIHNSSIGKSDLGGQIIVSIKLLGTLLRDMGLGKEAKVCCGKPGNQSIMVVKFSGTLSGLHEAERLHKHYAETKHGKAEFQQMDSMNSCINFETQKPSGDEIEDVLYGYLGIAEDLDKLDFVSKKRCTVKSKKEILDIADRQLNLIE